MMKMKHIIMTGAFALIAALLVAACVLLRGSQRKGEKDLIYVNKWVNTYDENGNLVKETLLFPMADEPSEERNYRYNAAGNCIECQVIDYAYDEAHGQFCYEYDEDGRLIARTEDEGRIRCELSYEEDEVIATTVKGIIIGEKERYTLEDGKVVSAEREGGGNGEFYKFYTCSYDGDGRLKIFGMIENGIDEIDSVYTYTYDENGRYAKIFCMRDWEYSEGYLCYTAEFVYRPFSKDYTAYIYDWEDKLVGKYEYVYGKNGMLSEVQLYVGDEFERLIWGTGYEHYEFDYPGGEIPDNFFYY